MKTSMAWNEELNSTKSVGTEYIICKHLYVRDGR